MNKLRQMNLFMRIVEAGSITKAAEKLDLSKSVLSQHLKQLESELSTTLLKRTTRRQSLTPAGERFFQHCVQMNQLAEQAWDEVMAQQVEPSGNLTITAPHALMESLVVPALTKTFHKYPKVRLSLICQDEQLDLMQRDIDLALRVGTSQDSRYKQRLIGTFTDILCQSRNQIVDIDETAYVANAWQGNQISHVLHDNQDTQKQHTLRFTPTHVADTIGQTASLIASGFGVGIVPNILLPRYPDLIPVFSDRHLALTKVYTVHPYSGAVPVAVKLAQEAMQREFEALMLNIEGHLTYQ